MFEVVADIYDSTRPLVEVASYDESDRLLELSAHCNASRVTFYTVEAAGLRAPISWRIDHSLLREASVDFTVDTNLEAPLAELAQATGGRMIANRNTVLPALRRVSQDFGTYYSLGYEPGDPDSSLERRIEVRVSHPDVQVRHRRSFRSKSVEEQMADTTIAALQYDPIENPFGLDLEVGTPPYERQGRRRLVPVRLIIPIRQLGLIPGDERGYSADLSLSVAASDKKGRLSGIVTDGDLRRTLTKKKTIHKLKVEEIMSTAPKSVSLNPQMKGAKVEETR